MSRNIKHKIYNEINEMKRTIRKNTEKIRVHCG